MMAQSFSPDGLAALAYIKRCIRESVGLAALDERALMLAGLPQERIGEEITIFCKELRGCFAREGMSENLRTGFMIASAELVRERIAEMELNGSGRA